MKKSTLLTLALALTTVAANADEKVIYQDNFTDQAASLANWTNSRGGAATTATSIASTSDGNYIQFGNGTASFNGLIDPRIKTAVQSGRKKAPGKELADALKRLFRK